ncbi:MAG: hypothetical protein KDD04_08045, partial [Sinomicrobium sp.]|nr:hypothetical protein [Sinomicrobium sp.]
MPESKRIKLIRCDEKLIKLILQGDEYLSKELDIHVPDQWSEFGKEVFEYILRKMEENPVKLKWSSYLPIEKRIKTLLGSCGYKGEPDKEGMVEIGYEVAKDYRNQ